MIALFLGLAWAGSNNSEIEHKPGEGIELRADGSPAELLINVMAQPVLSASLSGGDLNPDYTLRRARLSLDASPTKALNASLQIAADDLKVKVRDAHVELRPNDWLRIRAGLMRLPTGLERESSARFIPMVERSGVADLVPSRTNGVELRVKKDSLRAAVAVAHPSDLDTLYWRDDGAFDTTGMVIWSTDTARVGLRGGALHRPAGAPGVETVSPLTDDPLLAPYAWAGTAAAGGLDMIVVVGPLRLAAEGAVLREGLTLGTVDGHALHTAGYLLAGVAPGGTRGGVNDSAPLLDGWEALVRIDARTSASPLGSSAWTAGANLAVAYAIEPGARLTAELGPQVVHLSSDDTTTPGVVGRVSFVLGL
ncbi:OprO/OprP family phosphate-selective porin [Myxococcota bacterium]|nr:OprO/OprP family phosphate-selective porin [Myxococcota bacterium]